MSIGVSEVADQSVNNIDSNSYKDWSNFGFDSHYPLVSRSKKMKEIFSLIKKISKSNATVLIQGETGTGKELIAGLIQFISPRANKPFVKVNCAALPENLLESELFGHEKGAFTGAFQAHAGKFEQAHQGTIFLDEIGDMHLTTQSKILRVLQDREFSKVGSSKNTKVDVRIIAATNKDLEKAIEDSDFRADLYYRINVVNIHLPPLRERIDDIPLIAEFFRRKLAQELRKPVGNFSEETKEILMHHRWPGNIRELRNIIERAVLIVEEGQMITPRDLSLSGKDYFAAGGPDRRQPSQALFYANSLNLAEIEKGAIEKALELNHFIQKDAAKLLGVSSRVLNYKISQYNITHPSWRKNSN
ncbi:MAG TPA: sigma-54-dependent Fis family transcriptional regulator [Bacteroidetes bacterium]|nr:sigma-54-dependent Fis family transcriptional regulator [Bacteroidota bacterium]